MGVLLLYSSAHWYDGGMEMFAIALDAAILVPDAVSTVGWRDVLDMLIVSVLIYFVLIFIKQTRSFFILNSVIFLILVSYLSKRFDFSLTRQLFQPLLTFVLVIYVVVFQREIRRFFDWFFRSGRRLSILRRISISSEVSSAVVRAVTTMAEQKTGAIIVFPGDYPLEDLVEGGVDLNGKVSVPLILSIFDSNTPGHDGAMLIQNNQIKKFGLHLPLAEEYKSYAKFGTRHRAAAGITERTDALAIVVSEERGTISLSEGGALKSVTDPEELEKKLKDFFKENIIDQSYGFWHYVVVKNLFTKIASVVLAVAMWFLFVYQTGFITQEYVVPIEFRFLPKEYVIEEVTPDNVLVTISGSNTDFTNFDSRQLKVSVDLSKVGEGTLLLPISRQNLNLPTYFALEKVDPYSIEVIIVRTSPIVEPAVPSGGGE